MHLTFLRSALFAGIALAALAPVDAAAQSQPEMNARAEEEFEAADGGLNKLHKQLTNKLDKDGQEKLRTAQRAWIQFRDAEAQWEADKEARGGSMAPLVYHSARTALTKTRLRELRRILHDMSK